MQLVASLFAQPTLQNQLSTAGIMFLVKTTRCAMSITSVYSGILSSKTSDWDKIFDEYSEQIVASLSRINLIGRAGGIFKH